MKKLYILLAIILAPFFVVAQNPDLFEHRWFVHRVRDSNISNNIMDDVQNTHTELRFEMIFENDRIVLQGCCGGILEVAINYIGAEEIEIVNVTEIESIACEISYVTNFYQRIKGVFESMIGTTIPYTIQFSGNMYDGSLYEITLSHPGSNSFIRGSNFPNETTMDSHAPFSNNFNPEEHYWSLVEIHYDGEVIELPYGAAKTVFNIYDGSFEVALCGTVEGSMKFSWFWDTTSPEGYCFISCGELENITDTCEDVAGIDPVYLENFKQKIYNFLDESISPVGEEMYYQLSSHYTSGSFYKLIIKMYPNNQLIFYSNEGYLNTVENNLQPVITLYPNPVNELITIIDTTCNSCTVKLYSLNGKLLYSQPLKPSQHTIDVKQLNTGTYFLVIETQEGQKTVKKVVKR